MWLAIGVGALPLAASFAGAETPYTVAWTRQIGTSGGDAGFGIDIDGSGNVYLSGSTQGLFMGATPQGGFDAFLSKLDPSGATLWTKQFGSTRNDDAFGVSVDDLGGVFVVGSTEGAPAGVSKGGVDAYLFKFDAEGNTVWSRQIGTTFRDEAFGVAADGLGNVYLTGQTGGSLPGPNQGVTDAFLHKFDALGNVLWSTQIGSHSTELGADVAVDGQGNTYVTGYTISSLAGPTSGFRDAFVTKFSATGERLWIRQMGTDTSDVAAGIAADGFGNIYVAGQTYGALAGPNAGGADMFATKYDAQGNLLWTKQFGTASFDAAYSIATDAAGNAYITGVTHGSFAGELMGEADLFLTKLDPHGNVIWSQQLGSPQRDEGWKIAIDSLGSLYLTGQTNGPLQEPYLGGDVDAFAIKLVVPEPSGLLLVGAAIAMLSVSKLAKRRATGKR